ncbi:class I SAM-dependent methyltransferase [Asanoa sp. WMMD1127]|uniref:SAM-dependent methyltransferase n=1 Tax=Asanoa sp. WMMD1127 TaxID=3016107 RepID=UPI002415FA88|nr:class I SAM-dependent methyltransferase [Asanoa sp. WMMD1127]MDG4825536.1 class I SAM-dependent methyltransferase [Asanoa sp. WMMD1127]
MSDAPAVGSGTRLDFNGPLSGARADRLAAELARGRPATVVDLGCGWGELLLRVLAAAPDARGVGVDSHGPDVVRARANAAERGLAERVTFVDGPAAAHQERSDVVLNVGAYHALGDVDGALRALRELVAPGGRLLFGAEFWEHPPPPERLARMWPGATAADCDDLPGLVDRAIAAGFRPLRIETVTADEWAEFESGLAADGEEWLLAHPDDPAAAELRARLDSQRDTWLRGHRGLLGFAYLTLGLQL